MKTLVLLSGGIDSAVVLGGCVASGDECLAVGVDYDQPHQIELDHAQDIAEYYGVPFERVGLPAMFNAKVGGVVFAGRNMILASVAIAIAQARGFDRIAVGCNWNDWEVFADCRPKFWLALKTCAEAYGVGIVTPLIQHTKRDVVAAAAKLNVPLGLTWSCYDPQPEPEHEGWLPCEKCLACTTRAEALR